MSSPDYRPVPIGGLELKKGVGLVVARRPPVDGEEVIILSEEDFPKEPLIDLTEDEYTELKKVHVGTALWPQTCTQAELESAGYTSWKAYCIEAVFDFW